MPAKTLIVESKADKQFLKLPRNVQSRIILAYRKIKGNPISGAKLSGKLKSYYKYRVGDYRIIYRFDNSLSLVSVVKIEHRQGVYR